MISARKEAREKRSAQRQEEVLDMETKRQELEEHNAKERARAQRKAAEDARQAALREAEDMEDVKDEWD